MIKIKSLEQELFGTITFFGEVEDSLDGKYIVLSISSQPGYVIAKYGGELTQDIVNGIPFWYNLFVANQKDFLEFSKEYQADGFEFVDVGPHRLSILQQKIKERGLKHIEDISTKVKNFLGNIPKKREITC